MTAKRHVAVFDVDNTLTTRDCVVPFLRTVAGYRRFLAGVGRQPLRLGRDSLRRDRDALKALAAEAAFTGRPRSDVLALGRRFAHRVHDEWLRPDSVERLEAHRTAGDAVLLVSASFEVYLDPLGELLGVDDVIGTRLVVHPSGVLTGRLDGPNCRGEEKVRRLHAWLDTHCGGRSHARVVAYGDSPGDRALLADADEANWVGAAR